MPIAVVFYKTVNSVKIEAESLEDGIRKFRRWSEGDQSVVALEERENLDQADDCEIELYATQSDRRSTITCSFAASDPFGSAAGLSSQDSSLN